MDRLSKVLKDEPMVDEIREHISAGRNLPKAAAFSVTPKMLSAVIEPDAENKGERGTRPWSEAVIFEYLRPVLYVRNNRFDLPDSPEMRKRLVPARKRLEARLPAVGRIEFRFHPSKEWGGTGWMVAERTIATNRHVATQFAVRAGSRISVRKDFLGNAVTARIDFREEYAGDGAGGESFEVEVERVIFMEADDERAPDVALLRLKKADGLPAPIPVLEKAPGRDSDIVVVGYPNRDPRGVASAAAAFRVFGDVYGVKRLSPGKVMMAEKKPWYFTHDASTLGGSSGSVVIDVDTGYAAGMHFSGELKEANYAVKGSTILDYLAKTKVRVSVPTPPSTLPAPPPDDVVEEDVIEDYSDRDGYDPKFIAADATVALPKATKWRGDVVTFEEDGTEKSEMKYTHFSVVMCKSRRLCLFSAVNIDGESATYRGLQSPGWRKDWRAGEYQIKEECYGRPPKFSRGHMTRREDPIWGAAKEEAARGNADTFHVTNATPQMQPFNAPVWLRLEDYALQNARRDKMRISVFTGPVLSEDDPERYGVLIPLEFWKVIAFIHDETGELCATGYEMDQTANLQPEAEFVFGRFVSPQLGSSVQVQVPVARIARRAGLDFGPLPKADPMAPAQEGVGGEEGRGVALATLEQIRFL